MLKQLLKQKLPIILAVAGLLFSLLAIFEVRDLKKLNFVPLPSVIYPALLVGVILVLISIALFLWTEQRSGKMRIQTPEVDGTSGGESEYLQPNQRISLMGATTDEIEQSSLQKHGIIRFYKCILEEIQRTTLGLNTCGAEPLRTAFFEYYQDKLTVSSRAQMRELDKRVRWYWFKGDNRGLNFEPGCYEAFESSTLEKRTLDEVYASDAFVIWAGRTGTSSQLVKLISYHENQEHGINFHKKPFIILGWFGGSVKRYIDENSEKIEWIMRSYPELEPSKYINDWYTGNNPEMLAERVVRTIQRLLG